MRAPSAARRRWIECCKAFLRHLWQHTLASRLSPEEPITFVTMSRWAPMSFALSSSAQGDALDDHLIAIQGIPVLPDKLLVNTVKNNEVLVYNAIKKAS